jgi:hypothetical protein
MLATAAPAGAYIGNWNSNNGCPVDDPAMLASPAGDYTACVSFFGGGPWKLGNLNLRAGISYAFGVHGPDSDGSAVVPGRTWGSPFRAYIDSGLPSTPLSSVCSVLGPHGGPPPRDPNSPYNLCLALSGTVRLDNLISVYIEPVGGPANFRLSGVTGTGPVVTLPVKFRVDNVALGPNCYIGSDSEPIPLNLTSSGPPSIHYNDADPNGFAVTYDGWALGGDLLDTSFALPAAHGCGSDAMDTLVNLVVGLPSPSGNNSVSIYREFSTQSTSAGGAELAQAYHAALGP